MAKVASRVTSLFAGDLSLLCISTVTAINPTSGTSVDGVSDSEPRVTFATGVSGRSADGVRPNNKSELVSTIVAALPLDEASAKIRTGPPIDDKPDYDLDVWAGEIPLMQVVGAPIADPKLQAGVSAPSYVSNYSREAAHRAQ